MRSALSFIVLLCFCSLTSGQDMARVGRLHDSLSFLKEDTSRVNVLRALGNSYYGILPDSAIWYARKGMELSEKIGWTKGIAQNCLNLGTYLYYISRYDSSIYYSTKALAAAKIVDDVSRIALLYINRGNSYTETHQFEKAIADISAGVRLAEQTNNKDRLARGYQAMCELYMYQEKNEAALPWAEKALTLSREVGDISQQGVSEMSLGSLLSIKNKFAEAEVLLLDAVQKLNQAHRPDMIIECSLSLADLYVQLHKPQKAVAVLQTGLHNAHALDLIDRESAVDYNLGQAYMMLEEHGKALSAYRNGYTVVKGKKEFQKNQSMNLRGMAESYARLGNFDAAYNCFSQSVVLKDSAEYAMQNGRLAELQTRFETDRKEAEIELLKKDQELAKVALQKQQAIKAGAFILSGLIILIGLLVINRNRAVGQAKRLIEIEKLRNHIARDLHDDIGSALSSISINSRMALTQGADPSLAKFQLERINKNSISIMENMGDIVWAINPAHDSMQSLVVKMKEFLAEIADPLNIHYTIEQTPGVQEWIVDVKKRKELYCIFKEAINNAVKYSRCKNILVSVAGNKKEIFLTVHDDGDGFDSNKVKRGNGLNNMQQRAVAINGSLTIASGSSNGTTVTLRF